MLYGRSRKPGGNTSPSNVHLNSPLLIQHQLCFFLWFQCRKCPSIFRGLVLPVLMFLYAFLLSPLIFDCFGYPSTFWMFNFCLFCWFIYERKNTQWFQLRMEEMGEETFSGFKSFSSHHLSFLLSFILLLVTMTESLHSWNNKKIYISLI